MDSSKNEDLLSKLRKSLPDVREIENQRTIAKYRIGESGSNYTLTGILRTLTTMKENKVLRDFSVAQASLDDVFVEFARENEVKKDHDTDQFLIA